MLDVSLKQNWQQKQMTLIQAIAADETMYPVEKLEAHRRGVLHLAISIFVFSDDHLLIQRRANGKYHSGGQWANSCCSHPNWGEGLDDCADRRLQEELGFRLPLTKSGVVEYDADVGNGLREWERVHIFHGTADRESLFVEPNPEEVSDFRWVEPSALSEEMAENPESFTPWFRIYAEKWPDLCTPAN